MKHGFLIAAPMSGSGKTTVSRGLMALLTQHGYRVQPFKCGPDYIDTKFHEAVCGCPSVNLDTFMATPQHVRDLYDHYGEAADVCVVEGMMGLYDGYERDRGSSAEIARELGLPVLLVVDARSAAYSMAALLQGLLHFREDIKIAGIIFNKVGSARHEQMLREVCDDLQTVCLGCLPKHRDLEQGERYLGLDFSEKAETAQLTQLIERHVDWQRLLLLTETKSRTHGSYAPKVSARRVVVARNEESFSFIYQETLDNLGPDVTCFNPEKEVPVLDDDTLLYLPGGYPEKHLTALAGNESCRQAIRDFAERGGRVVAECGGMMYLCEAIVDDSGRYPMCGVLPYTITARRADRKLSLGYRRFELEGHEYRGHEFHYTQFEGAVPPSVCQVYNARGEATGTPVFRQQNVLASYTHLYDIKQWL